MADLWPWRPFPRSTETLSGLVNVYPTGDTEYREVVRNPRLSLSYSYGSRDPNMAKMMEAIAAAPRADWLVPVWTEGEIVTGLSSGATSIPIDGFGDYRDGGQAVVWGGCDNAEVVDITTVDSGGLALDSGLSQDYAAAFVAPIVTAWTSGFDGSRVLSGNRTTNGAGVLGLVFNVRDEAPAGATPWPQYEGLDLVSQRGRIAPLQFSFAGSTAVVDGGAGDVALEATRDYDVPRYTIRWRFGDAETRWSRKQWLYYINGRSRPFWLGGWQHDLTLAAPIGAADTSILVEPSLPVLSDYVGRHILIDDGTKTAREITAAADDGGKPRLSITALGRSVTSAKISFLRHVRMASDVVSIEHVRGLSSEMTLPVVEIPE